MARLFHDPASPVCAGAGCGCGGPGLAAQGCAGPAEDAAARVVEAAVARAVFGRGAGRRRLLAGVGSAAAMAALAQVFPLAAASEAFAQAPGPLEKKSLRVGFIPITCATPIIMAGPMGHYARQGLDVELVKTAGWAIVRDKAMSGEFDAAHMLAPMPLAISMGVGSAPVPWTVPAIENVNGQAIVLAMKHRERRDPATWRGTKLGVAFDFSIHNYLLRYYLAEAGLDPDRDVQIRVLPPAEMVANLRADNLDGFLGPDPVNQRAVYDGLGFIHLLSREIWDGHPCCAFAVSRGFAEAAPNTTHALLRAVVEAAGDASKAENRKDIADTLAVPNYLNQPPVVVEQVLTGTYADGLGGVKHAPDRVSFAPMPWDSFAVWIMTQMKRWGQVRGDLDYAGVARQVFLATDAERAMREAGLAPPAPSGRTIVVMGKPFDPAQPEAYLASFPIRRT
ncbi:MAG: CmpA/NrtA family ABC transporter substrate-binding protein [Janthinobacterium lividum]